MQVVDHPSQALLLIKQRTVQRVFRSALPCAGKLHFVKFETQRINDCIDFIEAKGLHRTHNGAGEPEGKVRVVATGGGAYKFAEMFQVRVKLSFSESAALATQPDISACAGACVFQSQTCQRQLHVQLGRARTQLAKMWLKYGFRHTWVPQICREQRSGRRLCYGTAR